MQKSLHIIQILCRLGYLLRFPPIITYIGVILDGELSSSSFFLFWHRRERGSCNRDRTHRREVSVMKLLPIFMKVIVHHLSSAKFSPSVPHQKSVFLPPMALCVVLSDCWPSGVTLDPLTISVVTAAHRKVLGLLALFFLYWHPNTHTCCKRYREGCYSKGVLCNISF